MTAEQISVMTTGVATLPRSFPLLYDPQEQENPPEVASTRRRIGTARFIGRKLLAIDGLGQKLESVSPGH